MTLVETYLLASDLSLIKNSEFVQLCGSTTYKHHNDFNHADIFPEYSNTYVPAPRIQKVTRWGRHIFISCSTCTVVFKLSYRTSVTVARQWDSALTAAHVGCLLMLRQANGEPLFVAYNDPLGCGYFAVYPAGITPSEFAYLGMDVFDSGFTPQYLMAEATKLMHVESPIGMKSFIMSPGVCAWVDNDWASEALFLAGIHPLLPVEAGMSFGKATVFVRALKTLYGRVLECARNDFGSTAIIPASALYSVYDRADAPCVLCDTTIQKLIIDSRHTYMCPACQAQHKKAGTGVN